MGPQQTFSSSPGFSVFTDSVSLVGILAAETQKTHHCAQKSLACTTLVQRKCFFANGNCNKTLIYLCYNAKLPLPLQQYEEPPKLQAMHINSPESPSLLLSGIFTLFAQTTASFKNITGQQAGLISFWSDLFQSTLLLYILATLQPLRQQSEQ